MGVVGAMAVVVFYQLWKTLRAVEQILTVEIRHTIQEMTNLISSLKENFGHVNSTMARLSDSVFKVTEIFQGPWMNMLGLASKAMGFFKKGKEPTSKSSKRK